MYVFIYPSKYLSISTHLSIYRCIYQYIYGFILLSTDRYVNPVTLPHPRHHDSSLSKITVPSDIPSNVRYYEVSELAPEPSYICSPALGHAPLS
jgi:hypothetical protein